MSIFMSIFVPIFIIIFACQQGSCKIMIDACFQSSLSISFNCLLHLLQQMPLTSTDLIICKGRTWLWRRSCGMADQLPSRSDHGPTCGATAFESYSDSKKFQHLSVFFSFQDKDCSHIRKWTLWLHTPNLAVAPALLPRAMGGMKFWQPWSNLSYMQRGRFGNAICPRNPPIGSHRNSTDQFQMNCRPSLKRWTLPPTIQCWLRLQGLIMSHWIKPSVCKTEGPSKVGRERFKDLSQFSFHPRMIPTTALYRPRRVRVCSWLSRCISPEVGTRADNNPNILAGLCRLLRCQMVPTCFLMFYAQNSVSKAPPAWMPESLSDYSKSVRECTKCSHRKMSNPPGPCRGTLALKYNEDTSTFQWKLRQLRGLERFKRYHRNRTRQAQGAIKCNAGNANSLTRSGAVNFLAPACKCQSLADKWVEVQKCRWSMKQMKCLPKNDFKKWKHDVRKPLAIRLSTSHSRLWNGFRWDSC